MSDPQTLNEELIARAPDAIIFADCAGVIRLWNPAAETMFGHGTAEAIGQTLDLIVPEPYRVAHWAGFPRPAPSGSSDGRADPRVADELRRPLLDVLRLRGLLAAQQARL